MIVVLKREVVDMALEKLIEWLKKFNVEVHKSIGENDIILGLVGDVSELDANLLLSFDIVENVIRISEPFKLANRRFHKEDSVIKVGNLEIGGGTFHYMAGPCAVESREQLDIIADAVHESGATVLRGGAFKPRTSPYSFQGMGEEGLKLLSDAKKRTGMLIVSELMNINDLDLFYDVDIIQIGARNMQNFELLKELGRTQKTVLLKRGGGNTIDECLMSVEYIMAGGNSNILICERGIRTFEKRTRNTMDISAIAVLKDITHLPVIADPSHGTGYVKYVEPLALASVAAGADGLIVEVHHEPEKAFSDGPQSLKPDAFTRLVEKCEKIRKVLF